jgi:hypothetical protein
MTMLRSLGAILLIALLAGPGAHAETRRAEFLVSATVPERVTLEAVEQPLPFTVSEADIERGYKDVSARYVVTQNSARGWLLRLSPRLGLTRHVEVRGLGADVVMRQAGVVIFRRGAPGRENLSLGYRFVLGPDARPGSYDLPVHVSATTL